MNEDLSAVVAYNGLSAELTTDFDVIDANDQWRVAFPGLGTGVNVIAWWFSESARNRIENWPQAAEGLLSMWLWQVAVNGENERVREVIEQASAASNGAFDRYRARALPPHPERRPTVSVPDVDGRLHTFRWHLLKAAGTGWFGPPPLIDTFLLQAHEIDVPHREPRR